jgi:hypothetical protein
MTRFVQESKEKGVSVALQILGSLEGCCECSCHKSCQLNFVSILKNPGIGSESMNIEELSSFWADLKPSVTTSFCRPWPVCPFPTKISKVSFASRIDVTARK